MTARIPSNEEVIKQALMERNRFLAGLPPRNGDDSLDYWPNEPEPEEPEPVFPPPKVLEIPTPRVRWPLVSPEELITAPPPAFLVQDYLVEGEFSQVFGRWGSGKSF